METKNRITYFIREYRDRPATRREVIELLDAEITDDYIAQRDLIRKRILTRSGIMQYQKNGTLNSKRHRSTRQKYFLKSEVQAVFDNIAKKEEKPQGKLF